jgi:hypothetical protein
MRERRRLRRLIRRAVLAQVREELLADSDWGRVRDQLARQPLGYLPPWTGGSAA